ncbi:MAG: GNAT family N-acetyltransferase [Acidimicrobiales bacterium]
MNAPLLRTKRTIMMPLSAADVDEVSALYADPEVMTYVDGGTRTRAQTKSSLAAAERCWRAEGWGLWAIRHAETGAFIGEGGLQHFFEVDGAPLDFGMTLNRRFWGQGYATEAGHVIVLDAWERFDGLLIHAVSHPENQASAAVLRKLGFGRIEERRIHHTVQQLWAIQRVR